MKTEKKFDAVKMMQAIRDQLSHEFANMSFEEQKRYIQEHLGFRWMEAKEAVATNERPPA